MSDTQPLFPSTTRPAGYPFAEICDIFIPRREEYARAEDQCRDQRRAPDRGSASALDDDHQRHHRGGVPGDPAGRSEARGGGGVGGPGRLGPVGSRDHGWGMAPVRARYLIDKSALARMPLEPVRRRLAPIIEAGDAATCAIIDLEVLFSARNGEDHEKIRQRRSLAYISVPFTEEIL